MKVSLRDGRIHGISFENNGGDHREPLASTSGIFVLYKHLGLSPAFHVELSCNLDARLLCFLNSDLYSLVFE